MSTIELLIFSELSLTLTPFQFKLSVSLHPANNIYTGSTSTSVALCVCVCVRLGGWVGGWGRGSVYVCDKINNG